MGRRRQGQAVVEYVIVLACLLGLVAVFGWFLGAADRYAERTSTLMSSDRI